ncbi:C4-dicarboxylate ABC transporter [Litchfieldella anticariensis FP35 = DSM 16096]|uniref:C4-dicarboxylate ABC transporter n=1 Tax=Litchfieldella anticariensis (strain DSM 16096 / CECT 5854 / CIP 108499 / LMG 22089 / FP35) TaxID=1121939 RepID=S2KXZ5_LITA3|nr:TRAP transporter substrate-binding protein [Halomonas anticariensis]EPC00269.1 C4-dicarboxylate ABC transporter [Halomonas anticariensis FP35 = DSM 16096]
MIKQLITSTVLGAAILSSQALLAADFTLKFGHLANQENIWHQAAVKFKEEVEANSDGRVEVQIYPNEQLGAEMDVINSIQLGTADMTITGESLQNWAPKAAMMAVPYAFRDSEHLHKAVEGEIGDEIEAQITERTNLVPLAWFERGPRHLTSNRSVRQPADLDGLRLRVPNVPLFVDTWEALGARPTPMAFSEVFTALQQNTIQAQENPLSLIESASFYEVQDYVNLTSHVRSWIYVVIGKDKLESMPEDLQQVIFNAAETMQTYEAELFKKDEQRLRQDLQERGMEFIEVDTEAFAEKARPAVLESLNEEQKELFEAIQNL